MSGRGKPDPDKTQRCPDGASSNGVELAERREPSGDEPLRNRGHLTTHRSACALPLTLIQRHAGQARTGQNTALHERGEGSEIVKDVGALEL